MTPYEEAKSRGDTRAMHHAARDLRRSTAIALAKHIGYGRRKIAKLKAALGEV